MDGLVALLNRTYCIDAVSVHPAKGGFSTKVAYRAVGRNGTEYFVKVYDGTLPTTRFFVDRIDAYMPVLEWIAGTPDLRGRVLTPVRALNGDFKVRNNDDVYALFIFVQGDVPGIDGITPEQTIELAKTLALLHNVGGDVPFDLSALSEDISLSFCDRLNHFLRNMYAGYGALYELVAPHTDILLLAIRHVVALRDEHRVGYTPLVLCHGDAHGNNVIQGDRLVLADWEDLRLAPPEADLFINDWYPRGELMMEAYAVARRGYRINWELVDFYVLRRRIEDVWVDIQRLTEEAQDGNDTEKLLDYVRRGIDKVYGLV